MPYSISWFDPDKILFMQAPGSISEADVFDADRELRETLTRAKSNRIHLIIDDSKMLSMPGVSVTMKIKTLDHPKMGWTVVIGQSDKVYRMLYTITCHLRKLPLYFALNMDEAATFLSKTQ
ncbi:MAG: hypothetical protein K8S54_00320 [Spirochaetia bacterium]|nr:hypothetical protein [Spirochaetia bacterium]